MTTPGIRSYVSDSVCLVFGILPLVYSLTTLHELWVVFNGY